MTPLLGLTQYLRGAVVFTLKHTFRSVGLPSFRLVVTTSVKGPAGRETETAGEPREESLLDGRAVWGGGWDVAERSPEAQTTSLS